MLVTLSRTIIDIIHDYVVKTLVAQPGVMSEGNIDSCVERPHTEVHGYLPFPTIIDKAGCLLYSIVTFHPYNDGCHRTGLLSAMFFLFYNGYNLVIPEDSAAFLKTIADAKNPNAPSEAEVIGWIRRHTNRDLDGRFFNWMIWLSMKAGFPLGAYTRRLLETESVTTFLEERFKQKTLALLSF